MKRFRPSVDHANHVDLERALQEICKNFSVDVLSVPGYPLLPSDDQKQVYAKTFRHETLYVRSLPDKLVLSNPPFFVDIKTVVRKDTGNFSIELSSFYFNLELSKTRINQVFYLCLDGIETRIFSPLWARPSAIYIQPWWQGADRQIFETYAQAIKEHFEFGLFDSIPIYEKPTSGSGDPFLLIPIPVIKNFSSDLSSFLKTRKPIKVENFV